MKSTVRDYLERIAAEEPSAADLDALTQLHERHLLTVPFENLDIHRGVSIALDLPWLLTKIVTRRRGGFCYELNAAFAWLLRRLGFRVTLLAAEVFDGLRFGMPFDHLTLRVDLERPYLADVGFGDSFLRPLALDTEAACRQRERQYRIRAADGWFLMERRDPGESFVPQYRFTLTRRELREFEGGCRYHQTSPDSTFTRRAVCSRATPEGRVTVLKDRLVVTRGLEKVETALQGEDAWREALRRHCGVEL